ncbi:MAG TPA: DUF2905 family protein [Chloroflexia bacterium]|jgi:hypothetical protein
MPYDQIGKLLVVFGAVIVVVGIVFLIFGGNIVGRLPGDITLARGNFTCIAPLATMLILSILLTIIVNVVLRLLNR